MGAVAWEKKRAMALIQGENIILTWGFEAVALRFQSYSLDFEAAALARMRIAVVVSKSQLWEMEVVALEW